MLESTIEVPVESQPGIITIFQDATAQERKLMYQLFGDEFLPLNIVERVATLEDACSLTGHIYADLNALTTILGAAPNSAIAYVKLSVLCEALREDWIPDLGNSTQKKYIPIPQMQSGILIFTSATYVTTGTTVPSSLMLPSEELVKYLCSIAPDLLSDYYLPESSGL